MQTQVQEIKVKKSNTTLTTVNMGVADYCQLPVPGFKGATLGVGFVRVLDIPRTFDKFMEINPRVPSRSTSGILNSPICKAIMATLIDEPEEMVLKNRGLFILAENVQHKDNTLSFNLRDRGLHGLVDGGHSFAAIIEAIEKANESELEMLKRAYVKVHIVEGLKADQVVEIASGLNTSRAVDDVSLMNLQGEFDAIRRVLRDTEAENNISYAQGDTGAVYISELLVLLASFNTKRFNGQSHPSGLYSKKSTATRYYSEDFKTDGEALTERIELLPDILKLVDQVKVQLPEAMKKAGFKIGMAIAGGARLGSASQRGKVLPFTGAISNYKVPQAWVLPVVAAFRANLVRSRHGLQWRVNPQVLLEATIDQLAGIILAEHKASNGNPNVVGKSMAVYRACYDAIQLYLAKRRLL